MLVAPLRSTSFKPADGDQVSEVRLHVRSHREVTHGVVRSVAKTHGSPLVCESEGERRGCGVIG